LSTSRAQCRAAANLVRHGDPEIDDERPPEELGAAGGVTPGATAGTTAETTAGHAPAAGPAQHRMRGHVRALDELVRGVEELERWVTGSADAEDVRTWALRAAT